MTGSLLEKCYKKVQMRMKEYRMINYANLVKKMSENIVEIKKEKDIINRVIEVPE